jgi:cystathionine gamma-synthase
MRDLLTSPCWQAADLGIGMPDTPHAVSMALPLWQHVIGYEENDPAITATFRTGYPRFFLPPLISALFSRAQSEVAGVGDHRFVFPSQPAAQRCLDYVRQRSAGRIDLHPWLMGTVAVAFESDLLQHVRHYWRFSGEVVSTRLAESILENRSLDAAAGNEASQVIRQRMARLAGVGAGDVFLFPSGMAAVFAVHRMLQAKNPGRPSIQLDFPYVDVLKVQQEFGSGVTFLPVGDVYCEMPSNPLLRSVRLADFAPTLKAAGIPLVVDDTVASVVNIDALRHADVVTTSLTKSFSGACDVLAGAVTLNPKSAHAVAFRQFLEAEVAENSCLFGADAIVLEANSRDFPKRIRRMGRNAAALVEMLRHHPAVKEVFYPGKEPDDGILEILRPGAGYGPLFSFTLHNPSQAPGFYDRLQVCKGPSLGANFTLACPYTLLAHYQELDWAASCGVERNLIRVSAGLEETADLLERFAAAF